MNLKDNLQSCPKRVVAGKAYLDIHEIEKLEQAASNLRDRLLIRLLSHLGCRISEELGITVEDIDFVNNTITIQHLKSRFHLSCPKCRAKLGRSHIFCPGCGERVQKASTEEKEHRRLRALPIDGETIGMLRQFIDRGGPILKDGKKVLFGINRHRGWQIIRDCAIKAGLPNLINRETGRIHHVSPHRLRDFFAVHSMQVDDSGTGQRMLQVHLGHASFNTTARYRKVNIEEQQSWYNNLWKEAES